MWARSRSSSSQTSCVVVLESYTRIMSRVLFQDDLQALTVEDLKADPSLVEALRRLRASVNSAHISQPANATRVATSVVARPAATGANLNIWQVTHADAPPSEYLLRPTSRSNRLRVDANRLGPGGIKTISAPVPGWSDYPLDSNLRPLFPCPTQARVDGAETVHVRISRLRSGSSQGDGELLPAEGPGACLRVGCEPSALRAHA